MSRSSFRFALFLLLLMPLLRNAGADDTSPAPIATVTAIIPDSLDPEKSKQFSDNMNALLPPELQIVYANFQNALEGPDGKTGMLNKIGTGLQKGTQSRPDFDAYEIQFQLKKAQNIWSETEKRLFSKEVKDNPELCLAIYINYVRDVLLPMRDLATLIARPDELKARNGGDPIKALLPLIPKGCLDSPNAKHVAETGNPGDPYGLSINAIKDANGNDVLDSGGAPVCRQVMQSAFDFSNITNLKSDIHALSYVVTTESYARGLKLMTAQMLMAQIKWANDAIGDDGLGHEAKDGHQKIEIPEGCRQRVGGDIPALIETPPMSEVQRHAEMDMMLASSGFISGTAEYKAYYLNNVPANPESGDFNGYLPSEHRRAAQRCLDVIDAIQNPLKATDPNKTRRALEPAIDDQKNFQAVMDTMKPKVLSAMTELPNYQRRAENILSVDASDRVFPNGDPFPTTGLSSFLADRMEAAQTSDWEDPRVTPPQVLELLKHTGTTIPLPPLYGPDASRRWAFGLLETFAENPAAKKDANVLNLIRDHVCNGCDPIAFINQVQDLLKDFKPGLSYLPKLAFEETKFTEMYPQLRVLWEGLREIDIEGGTHYLPGATVSELKLMELTMNSTSWPSLRLATLIEKFDEKVKLEKYKRKMTDHQSLSPKEEADFKELTHAGGLPMRVMGDPLGLNRPWQPNHANIILNMDEKREVCQKIISDSDKQSQNIFSTPIPGSGKLAFDLMDKNHESAPLLNDDLIEKQIHALIPAQDQAAFRTELERQLKPGDDPRSVAQKASASQATTLPVAPPLTPTGAKAVPDEKSAKPPEIDPKLQSQIDIYEKKVRERDIAPELFKLYQAHGDRKTQIKIVNDLIGKYGITTSPDVKNLFLDRDNSVKKVFDYYFIKKASLARRDELKKKFKELCAFDTNSLKNGDLKNFKVLVAGTTKAQDALNAAMGLPGLPQSVKDQVESWTKGDDWNASLGGLQFALFAAAAVAGMGCMAASGGLCAPVVVSVLTLAATGTQLGMAYNSYRQAQAADQDEASVKAWADLGFTTQDQIIKVRQGHTYFSAIMDAAFTIPLLEGSVKAAQIGGRGLIIGSQKLLGREAVETAMKDTVVHEAQINASAAFLESAEETGLLERALGSGKRLAESVTTHVLLKPAVDISVDEANNLFADKIVQHFGGDSKVIARFTNFLDGYAGDRLDRVEDILERTKDAYSEAERLGFARKALKAAGFPERKIEKLSQQLVHGKRLRVIMSDLKALEDSIPAGLSKADRAKKASELLADYIEKNGTEFQEIFEALPLRKREIPWHFLSQGNPLVTHLPLTDLRIPVIAELGDGLIMKRAAIARENLIVNALRKEAQVRLGLPPRTAYFQTATLIENFIDQATEATDGVVSEKLSNFYSELSDRTYDLTKEKFPKSKLPPDKMTFRKTFVEAITHMDKTGNRALIEAWLSNIPIDEALGAPATSGAASEVLQRLGDYKNVDEFEDQLSALWVLTNKARARATAN